MKINFKLIRPNFVVIKCDRYAQKLCSTINFLPYERTENDKTTHERKFKVPTKSVFFRIFAFEKRFFSMKAIE